MFAKFIGESKTFYDVKDSEQQQHFLILEEKAKKKIQSRNGLQYGMTIYGG